MTTEKLTFWKEFKIGLNAYKVAMSIISKNKMYVYFIFPIIFNIILFTVGTKFTMDLIESTRQAFFTWIDFDNKNFLGHQYMNDIFKWLISLSIYIVFFFAYILFSVQIVMIFMSPVLSAVSEKVEGLYVKREYPFSAAQMLKDVIRGLGISIRNLIIEIIFMILMFTLSFVPILGLITPVIMFFVTAYFIGFSFLDYTNERRKMSVIESIRYVRKHKALAYANGSVFALFSFIPFCGASISAFISIFSVIAATASVYQVENQAHEQI